jgi:hypothetical protein
MSWALKILLAVAAVGTVTSTIYCAMAVVAAVRFALRKRREDRAPAFLPPVSVLKPLHGAEPSLAKSLEGFFQQEYPEYELLFCARQENDEGLQTARRIAAKYPAVKARFLTCGEPEYPNPKMWSLAMMGRAAQHELLVTSDADTRVTPDYLKQCMKAMADGKTALSSCMYIGTAEEGAGFAARLDAIGKSVEMVAGCLVADMVEGGTKFALGVTMILPKQSWEDAGGYDDLGQHWAEDFVLGNRLAESGRKVTISNHVIRIMVQSTAVDEEHAAVQAMGTSGVRADVCGGVWADGAAVGSAERARSAGSCVAGGDGVEPRRSGRGHAAGAGRAEVAGAGDAVSAARFAGERAVGGFVLREFDPVSRFEAGDKRGWAGGEEERLDPASCSALPLDRWRHQNDHQDAGQIRRSEGLSHS